MLSRIGGWLRLGQSLGLDRGLKVLWPATTIRAFATWRQSFMNFFQYILDELLDFILAFAGFLHVVAGYGDVLGIHFIVPGGTLASFS